VLTLRYTRWDGRQQLTFDADDVRQALEWLQRQGLDLHGMHVMGLDELLEHVREQLRDRYREYNLDSALDDMRRRLDELLELERDTLDERAAARPEFQAKRDFLDRLPHGLADAIEKLRYYGFEDATAAEEFRELLDELENIRKVEEFQRRQGELFQGPTSLDFERALELLAEMERLKQLERALMAGSIDGVSAEELADLLGAEAAESFENLRRMMLVLDQSGYLVRRESHATLSPKGVRKIGQLALRDIYQSLLRDRPGGHATTAAGIATLRPESTKPYAFGEPMHLDLPSTLMRAVARRPGTPLALDPKDFQVYEADDATSTSTVLLLDMSWSMSWEGRFAAAKKVAMAMESLIRSRYPRDYFAIVGFFTRAVELKLRDLPEASWNMGDPFTNLQDGLRLAAQLISRHHSTNQHFIVITDGQPTAYFQRGRLYCEWPLSFGGISMRAAQETLKEVERVTRMGVTINTFMLDDSPSLRAFVERMTRINRGRALYTRPDHLGEYLLVDYISRKRKRV